MRNKDERNDKHHTPKKVPVDHQKRNVAQGGGPSTNGAQQYFAT